MHNLAPIVIFAHRRPEHLRCTLGTLMRCDGFEQSSVIMYCDGPRHTGEAEIVSQTRDVAKTMLGGQAEYYFSETNLGLSRSVIAGVSRTVAKFGRAIVVEDDLDLSPIFLTFMNHALDRYADNERVFQISGHMFDLPRPNANVTALFLPFTTSWGWGTWKRAWDQFDAQATGWEALLYDRKLRRRFNLDGSYGYASMLLRQMSGLQDSWAIRWYWTVFKAHGLTLFPPTSLVRNVGFDGSGTHGRGILRNFSTGEQPLPVAEINLPQKIEMEERLYAEAKKALRRHNGGLLGQFIDWLRWWKYAYVYTQRIRFHT